MSAQVKPDAGWVANEFVKRYYEVCAGSSGPPEQQSPSANPTTIHLHDASSLSLSHALLQVLAKHPRYLNRFYKDESQFTLTWRNHGVPDTRETVSTTQVGRLI